VVSIAQNRYTFHQNFPQKGLVKLAFMNIDSGALRRRVPSVGQNAGDTVVSVKEIVWRELGACRGLEAAMFYPDDDDLALEAKAVCAGCDVRIACLEHALQAREKAGIWGGATERERRRMIRQRRRTA
jgi:WhiB family redox-sensing transcriptional regulator